MKPELIKFVAGTKAKASEVNENFEKVLNYAETASASALVIFDIGTEYNYGQWVFGQVEDEFGFYESLVERNKGHLLSDEAYWKKVSMGDGTSLITGQIIFSLDPIIDDGLHLADGSLLTVGGVYDKFITEYISNLYTNHPERFCTEEEWQESVTNYGICNKYVYIEGASVRLPKIGNSLYSAEFKNEVPAIGNGMTIGLHDPNGASGRTYGGLGADGSTNLLANAGLYGAQAGSSTSGLNLASHGLALTSDSTKSGIIADLTDITQPIEGYYYIVVATTTKTNIEANIDNIATDLNGKADTDLSNINASQSAKEQIVSWLTPDFTTEIIRSNTGFTSEKVQWLRIIGTSKGNSVTVAVNNTTVFISHLSTATTYQEKSIAMILLDKGDVITTSIGSNGTLTLVTNNCKGVN